MTCLEVKGAPPAAPLAREGDRAPGTAFKGSGASVAPVVPIPATAAEPVCMPGVPESVSPMRPGQIRGLSRQSRTPARAPWNPMTGRAASRPRSPSTSARASHAVPRTTRDRSAVGRHRPRSRRRPGERTGMTDTPTPLHVSENTASRRVDTASLAAIPESGNLLPRFSRHVLRKPAPPIPRLGANVVREIERPIRSGTSKRSAAARPRWQARVSGYGGACSARTGPRLVVRPVSGRCAAGCGWSSADVGGSPYRGYSRDRYPACTAGTTFSPACFSARASASASVALVAMSPNSMPSDTIVCVTCDRRRRAHEAAARRVAADLVLAGLRVAIVTGHDVLAEAARVITVDRKVVEVAGHFS